jgi:plasmid maintenance system antidote protein VapI
MKKKTITVRSAAQLAKALDLTPGEAVAMEFRARLNRQIAKLTTDQKITHAELAKRTGASRTRITAILNGQTQGVSTDFLLRLLNALGYKTTPTFSRAKDAA